MEELTARDFEIMQLFKHKNRMEQDQLIAELEKEYENVDEWRKIEWVSVGIRRSYIYEKLLD